MHPIDTCAIVSVFQSRIIFGFQGHNESLSQEVRDARKVIKKTEEMIPEDEVPGRQRRTLPRRPQQSGGDGWASDASSAVLSPPRRSRKRGGRSSTLISGLHNGGNGGDGGGDAGRDGGGAGARWEDDADWDDDAPSSRGTNKSLKNELAEACEAVDEEELIMLAQRFNAVKDQLDEAHLQLAERATEQDALEHALNEQDRLQTMLENACEELQQERLSCQTLQDELDEALGGDGASLVSGRSALDAPPSTSLANELAGLTWEAEKDSIASELAQLKTMAGAHDAEVSQLKAKVGALETELAVAKVANDEVEAKLAASNAEREKWEGQVNQLETQVAKKDQDALERQTAHEMAQSTVLDDVRALQKQISELGIELEVSRGVVKRVREESKNKIASATSKFESSREKFQASVAALEADLDTARMSEDDSSAEVAKLRQSSRETISELKKQLASVTSSNEQNAKLTNRELKEAKEQLAAKVADVERVHAEVEDGDKERMALQKQLDVWKREAQQMKVQRDQRGAGEKSALATVAKLEERLKKYAADHIATKTKLSAEEGATVAARNAVEKFKAAHAKEKAQFDVDLKTARKAAADAEVAHLAVQKELRDKITKAHLSSTESADKCTRAEQDAVRANTERLALMNELSEAQALHTSTMDAESKASEELVTLRANSRQLRETLETIEDRMTDVHARADNTGRELASTLTDLNRSMHDNAELTEKVQQLIINLHDKEDGLREAELEVVRERELVASLEADLQDAKLELQNRSAMQEMAVLNAGEQAIAFEQKEEEAAQSQAEVDRLQIEAEDAQRTISAMSDKARELALDAKRTRAEVETANSEARQLKENILELETEMSALQLEVAARVQAESSLAEIQQQSNDWNAERTDLLSRGKEVDGRLARTKAELAAAKTERDDKDTECNRLMTLIEDAGRNIKEHVAAGEASGREIERLRSALVHAETASKRAREWVEHTEASHEKSRAKIIERADREIRRQRDVITEAKSIGASLAEQLSALGGPINLVPVHSALVRIVSKVTALARTRRHAGNSSLANLSGIPPLPPAEEARGQEATLLLSWAQTLESTTTAVVDSVIAAGISAPTPTPTPAPAPAVVLQNNDAGAASDSVSRLLQAVKRFHSAEAVGQTLTAGERTLAVPHQQQPRQQQPQQHPPQQYQHDQLQHLAPGAGPGGGGHAAYEAKFNPAQMSMENIGEAPEQVMMPDSLDSKALSMAQLSTEEYTELHRDWKRLKTKVQDLSTRLRSAKAAVAVGKFREETQRVYIRNRDRLVSRIILKPANKSRTIRLLQMLQDTGV